MTAKNNHEEEGMASILEFRVSSLEAMVGEIRSAVKSIDSSLKVLASLEARHAQTSDAVARAFAELKDHEDRLRIAEADMPTMRLVRNWVIAGVIGCTSLVGVSVAGMVTIASRTQSAMYAQPEPRQPAPRQPDATREDLRGWR
ncbi:MAG: hypothetical protein Q8S32_17225 [Burkholderiaceae bacterium]|nr:hypothetical protein [Burkholderiaceae bacterium]